MDKLDDDEKAFLNSHIPNKQKFDEIVSLIKSTHPVVESYFYRSYGLNLMKLDSMVAEFVMMRMTEKEIVCLGIHDSFIVPEDKEEELRTAMSEAYHFIGYPLALPPIDKV